MTCEKTDGIIYALITNKYATYKEIRDDYTIEEVIKLYEICMVNLHNKWIQMEEAKNKKWQ